MVGRFQQPICETVTDAAAARVEGAMYAIPKGRDAVAPGLGCDPAAAPQRDRRLPWREQPTDQLGSLPEPLLLGRFCGGGKFSLGLSEHLRQGHREWKDGAVEIGRGHCAGSHAVACQAIASGRLVSGADNAA